MNFIKRHPLYLGLLSLVVVGILIIIFIGLRSRQEEPVASKGVTVEVEEVRVGSLTRTLTAFGKLIANQSVSIQPEIRGMISKVHVEGGEAVRKGQPLFEIDDRTIKAELKESEARYALAKIEYDRVLKLAAKKFSTQKAIDSSKTEFLAAEAAVESGKVKLEKTVIRAPFDGIVGLHDISVGDPVNESTEITTFVDITPIKVEFKLPAQYLRNINISQRVEMTVDGFGDKKLPALIEGIDATVDEVTHSITVKAITPNKDFTLKPGLFARIELVVGSKDNVLIIPEEAIENEEDQDYVYKAVEGVAFKVPVLTGIIEKGNIEVVRGLQEGDHVVTVGQLKLRNGYPVRYTLNGVEYKYNEAFWKKQDDESKAKDVEDQLQEEGQQKPAEVEKKASLPASSEQKPQGEEKKDEKPSEQPKKTVIEKKEEIKKEEQKNEKSSEPEKRPEDKKAQIPPVPETPDSGKRGEEKTEALKEKKAEEKPNKAEPSQGRQANHNQAR